MEKQAVVVGKGVAFAKPSIGRERRGRCGKQNGGDQGGGLTPEALLCPTEVAMCGGCVRDAEAEQV